MASYTSQYVSQIAKDNKEEKKREMPSRKEVEKDVEENQKKYENIIVGLTKNFFTAGSNVNLNVRVDLVQEGWIALYRALKRYDPKFECTFEVYLRSWVYGAMYRFLCKLQEHPESFKKKLRTYNELVYRNPEITEREIREETGWKMSTVRLVKDIKNTSTVSLDNYNEETVGVFYETVKDEEEESIEDKYQRNEREMRIRKIIGSALTPTQQKILNMKLFKGYSTKEISKLLGVTPRNVNKRLTSIYEILRQIPELRDMYVSLYKQGKVATEVEEEEEVEG